MVLAPHTHFVPLRTIFIFDTEKDLGSNVEIGIVKMCKKITTKWTESRLRFHQIKFSMKYLEQILFYIKFPSPYLLDVVFHQ